MRALQIETGAVAFVTVQLRNPPVFHINMFLHAASVCVDQVSGLCWVFGRVASFESRVCIDTGQDIKHHSPTTLSFSFEMVVLRIAFSAFSLSVDLVLAENDSCEEHSEATSIS